jgi:hypothetical protein
MTGGHDLEDTRASCECRVMFVIVVMNAKMTRSGKREQPTMRRVGKSWEREKVGSPKDISPLKFTPGFVGPSRKSILRVCSAWRRSSGEHRVCPGHPTHSII